MKTVFRLREGRSVRTVAKALGVSSSSVVKWSQLYRETGDVELEKIGGYRPAKITGKHRQWLIRRMGETDFTLRGLVKELENRELVVDYRTVWKFVHQQRWRHKKRRRMSASTKGQIQKPNDGVRQRSKTKSAKRALSPSEKPRRWVEY